MKRILLVAVCLPLAGCVGIIQNEFVKKAPTFTETESKWKPVSADKTRLVIYLPEHKFNAWDAGVIVVDVIVGEHKVKEVHDQSFFFIDIPPGQTDISVRHGLFIHNKIEVDLAAGNITYVRVLDYQPNAVPKDTAQVEIKDTHHLFKNPEPYYPKRKDRAI